MRTRIALSLTAALAIAAAPTAAGAQRLSGERPSAGSVEEGFWTASDKAERAARTSAELNTDPALNAYVRGVACKVAVEYCGDVRVYVLDRPFFNATMAPNGYTEVWSGLMLRASNEAELAFTLSHEVTHFERNHFLEAWNAEKNRQNAMLALSVGIAVLGATAAVNSGSAEAARSIMDATGNLIDVVYLAGMTAFFRFSRENEAEADALGVRRMAAAGYDPRAAATIWTAVRDETASSQFERTRKSEGRLNVFATHPLTRDRIASLEARAASLGAGGDDGRARYRAAIRPHLSAWLRDDLRRRDYGQTLFLLNRLAVGGEDLGVLEFYRGEAFRLRRQDGDLHLAEEAYAAASAWPDAPPQAFRELGELRRKRGDVAGARVAFETYLARAPQAEDAWLVQDSLQSMGNPT